MKTIADEDAPESESVPPESVPGTFPEWLEFFTFEQLATTGFLVDLVTLTGTAPGTSPACEADVYYSIVVD